MRRTDDRREPKVNPKFRAWTRGTSFTLAMGKTQVALLVAVAVSREAFIGLGHPMLRHFIPAIRGLEDRGLIMDHPDWSNARLADSNPMPLISRWIPTEAGEHVLTLLKCTGVFQEIRRELLLTKANRYGGYYEIRP